MVNIIQYGSNIFNIYNEKVALTQSNKGMSEVWDFIKYYLSLATIVFQAFAKDNCNTIAKCHQT